MELNETPGFSLAKSFMVNYNNHIHSPNIDKAGAIAGFVVDASLYPLDTLKTRLQSSQGFINSGGFRQIYKGVSINIMGSAPSAALFFLTYEICKNLLAHEKKESGCLSSRKEALIHMGAACGGEVVAAFVHVPTELIKQNAQVVLFKRETLTFQARSSEQNIPLIVKTIINRFCATLLREVPFAITQFPLYEYFKSRLPSKLGKPLSSLESAACGSLAGAIAAVATNPLDVIKTRIMLGEVRLLSYIASVFTNFKVLH
ncbi:hypothetical protein Zmor_003898 [Zophobas morio]|uniref:S-adenosylmethionine mitochondrial carrier protein n=1 Tax=Zophobas morio TaxID=2755281 RepID=A0AA38HN95_9CUCU|nr:hypothetical protein Zmor_003898 [Zophobas morio]